MKRLLTGALALTLLTGTALTGTVAMAQPGHHDNRNDHGANQGRDDHGGGHRWARGQRLPKTYYQDKSHYIDYRSHHLRAPPRGYRWVQTDDNNYAMVAITTGLIASLIAANR
jgi:Ni/Co efflux regulator RcnB